MTTEQRITYLRDLVEDEGAAPQQWRSEIRFLLAELDAARAREAKLREASKGVCDETHADGSAEIGAWIAAMSKLRAALAEGEGR